jgi:spermidine synthase
LAFATGFLSLSQEILWIRYAGFASLGVPQVLGVVLCFYLAGIALGAHVGKQWCGEGRDLYQISGRVLLVSAVFDATAPWAVTLVMGVNRFLGLGVLLPVLVLTAMFKSALFPVAHYLGSDKSGPHVGSSVSKVYFSNIAGSTLGPLLTGFVLLQIMGLQQNFELMAALTAMVGLLCIAKATRGGSLVGGAIAAVLTLTLLLPMRLVPLLIAASHPDVKGTVRHIVENHFGIVHVSSYPDDADNTFGGNAYDGKISVTFVPDPNSVYRVFALAAIHPEARTVLTIGLSTGAWAAVLAGFPNITRIDAVEINPGYLEIIPKYEEVKGILTDPRLMIHIDDGRRWVRRNPDANFDLIVINTTWHWRSYASLLLSDDFVKICKSRLLPGGVFAYNTTDSPDAFETVAREFKFAYRLGNFVIGSDRELFLTEGALAKTLEGMRINGKPVMVASDRAAMEHVHSAVNSFEPYATYRPRMVAEIGREPEPITDQNLVGEYRHSAVLQMIFGRMSKVFGR